VSHELTGNSIAEVEFANRNRIVKSEVQLTQPKCVFSYKIQYSTGQPDFPLVNIWYFLNSKHNMLK